MVQRAGPWQFSNCMYCLRTLIPFTTGATAAATTTTTTTTTTSYVPVI